MPVWFDVQPEYVRCEADELDSYVDLMNGLVRHCLEGGWRQGLRNEVIVDLTVGAYMLRLDPQEVLDEFVKAGIINPLADDESTNERLRRVYEYRYTFDWDWMIDPDYYADEGRGWAGWDKMPVAFRLAKPIND